MAKSELRLKARKLREEGKSIKESSHLLQVSASGVSAWTQDILLTIEQIHALRESELKGKALGRLKSALLHKNERLRRETTAKQAAGQQVSQLSKRELLLCGAALYWGEGNKKSRKTEFFNSDPKMIQFLLIWLQNCLNVKKKELYCRVGINESHELRDQQVKEYWSNIVGIPLDQFKKTSFKRVINKKIYPNHDHHYGTLTVGVVKSTDLSYKILGLIEGLYNGSVAQW